ncbi:MAG: eCIS core domain-containing protein, partial [Parafilimonas sp.]
MQNFASAKSFFISPVVQRKCAHCEEEEKKLQRKENDENNANTTADTENYLSSLQGGKNLGGNEKAFFESRLGYDFSNVQLHTNDAANQSAKNINARAYTYGNNIV